MMMLSSTRPQSSEGWRSSRADSARANRIRRRNDMSTSEQNPLREGVRLEKTADPCTVIIFGASGDLTKRKLVPALYRLTQQRLLPAEFAIVGFAHSPM